MGNGMDEEAPTTRAGGMLEDGSSALGWKGLVRPNPIESFWLNGLCSWVT